MNRYLVFSGLTYYPMGGWDDIVSTTDNYSHACEIAVEAMAENDWAHVVDVQNAMIVVRFGKKFNPLTYEDEIRKQEYMK